MKPRRRSLFDEAELEARPRTITTTSSKRVRGRADFLAWVAAQEGGASGVPGFEHALFMRWCSMVLLAGERVADESYDRLPPPPPLPQEALAAGAEVLLAARERETRDAQGVAAVDEASEQLLVAYTDGSGTTADRVCGAGVVVYRGDEVILEASRHLGLGTNNHAELSALRVALGITDVPGLRELELVIRSDSEYAIGCVTRAAEPPPTAKNAKLIGLVRAAMRGRRVRVEWVKGHAGVAGNERADELAGLARRRAPMGAGEGGAG